MFLFALVLGAILLKRELHESVFEFVLKQICVKCLRFHLAVQLGRSALDHARAGGSDRHSDAADVLEMYQ